MRQARPDLARRIALAPLGRGRGEGPARPENGRTHDARRLLLWFFTLLMSLAGSRPGGRPPFLLVQERRQRTRPQVCDPFAALRGKPGSGRLRGVPQNSLRACGAPFKQPRQVRQRCVGAATPTLTPQAPRPRRSHRGVNSPTRAIAALGPAEDAPLTRPSAAMARTVPPSLLAVPRSAGRGAGWRRRTPAFVN